MEMTEEGTAILVAMRDQQWLVLTNTEEIVAISPLTADTFVIPAEFFTPVFKVALRRVLLDLVVLGGLEWPWPPNHDERVHGEQPTYDS